MPDVRLVLGDVHRQLHELPHRSARTGAARQRHPGGHPVERKRLFVDAGRTIVELTRRYYEKDDTSVLPRAVAGRAAFHNAMALDVAMGGSTNTVLHILAAAWEGDVEFTMADIDALSRKVPQLCKVAPSTDRYHVEDVHRAGGVPAILGELDRAGLIDTSLPTVHSETVAAALASWDVCRLTCAGESKKFFLAGPAGVRTQTPFGQDTRWPSLDTDRRAGCIRSADHPYSPDGGLAVLYGNVAPDGCIVKTAGVPDELLVFAGPARVYESQDDAVEGILGGDVVAGDVVVVRYEGPRGGPGMQEMLYPTTYIKSRGLGASCALVTDGRFSGERRGCRSATSSPEAAEGGPIGLVRDRDRISIDIPSRIITLEVPESILACRRDEEVARGASAWTARKRDRPVSAALRAYAALTISAARGAVRDLGPSRS